MSNNNCIGSLVGETRFPLSLLIVSNGSFGCTGQLSFATTTSSLNASSKDCAVAFEIDKLDSFGVGSCCVGTLLTPAAVGVVAGKLAANWAVNWSQTGCDDASTWVSDGGTGDDKLFRGDGLGGASGSCAFPLGRCAVGRCRGATLVPDSNVGSCIFNDVLALSDDRFKSDSNGGTGKSASDGDGTFCNRIKCVSVEM